MGPLHLLPDQVDFGSIFIGQTAIAHATVRNDGLTTVSLQWTTPNEPFQMLDPPVHAMNGETDVVLRVVPREPGSFNSVLAFDSDGIHQEIALTGTGMALPGCPHSECTQAAFNVDTGTCVETPVADGLNCDDQGICVIGGTCQAGRCVGTPRSCDDGNACTVDVCNATTGCEHLPAPPCPGDGACMKGVCNPQTGCGMEPSDDGTACGPVQTCDAAQVCIAGACVMRDPPDGYTCAQASPCQGAGICAGSKCVRDLPTTLHSNWDFDSYYAGDPDGGVTEQLHDLVVEESGAVSLMGFFLTPPQLRANTPDTHPGAEGPARRCQMWNNRLLCEDYPAAVNGKISSIDMASGSTVWTFDIRAARPDFVDLVSTIFMARMAVQGPDRLAALFEAYPKSNNPDATRYCRNYFLVVLDSSGNLVSAQQLFDGVLDVCNHPHPYGYAADSVGNLFISFSPTIGEPAPLIPGANTTVMSFTRDGVFRWKFNDPNLIGGELAVATGLLYPENSSTAIMAATGQAAYSLAAPFGRLVVTQERSVPAPVIGGSTLQGYEAGTSDQRWTHVLDNGETFWSDQIRLANWAVKNGQRTVALTFTEKLGVKYLKAIDTHDGSEAFECPMILDGRSAPQLFEVTEAQMSVMEGSDACGKCDPPFANSSAAFHTYPLPLISTAHEPWVGTFGGAGHDHREEVLSTGP
jgi:hypothetical protein